MTYVHENVQLSLRSSAKTGSTPYTAMPGLWAARPVQTSNVLMLLKRRIVFLPDLSIKLY